MRASIGLLLCALACGYAAPFTVVLDCGSSGTRIYAYSWQPPEHAGELPRVVAVKPSAATSHIPRKAKAGMYERVETQPGLTHYLNDPKALAKHALLPLLDWAKAVVPRSQWKQTPVFLLATAGVRKLQAHDQDRLLEAVRGVLTASGFRFQSDWARVITGPEEGAFGWVAANYLTGSLGHTAKSDDPPLQGMGTDAHPVGHTGTHTSHLNSSSSSGGSGGSSGGSGAVAVGAAAVPQDSTLDATSGLLDTLDLGGSSLEVTTLRRTSPSAAAPAVVSAAVHQQYSGAAAQATALVVGGTQYELLTQTYRRYGLTDTFDRSVAVLLQEQQDKSSLLALVGQLLEPSPPASQLSTPTSAATAATTAAPTGQATHEPAAAQRQQQTATQPHAVAQVVTVKPHSDAAVITQSTTLKEAGDGRLDAVAINPEEHQQPITVAGGGDGLTSQGEELPVASTAAAKAAQARAKARMEMDSRARQSRAGGAAGAGSATAGISGIASNGGLGGAEEEEEARVGGRAEAVVEVGAAGAVVMRGGEAGGGGEAVGQHLDQAVAALDANHHQHEQRRRLLLESPRQPAGVVAADLVTSLTSLSAPRGASASLQSAPKVTSVTSHSAPRGTSVTTASLAGPAAATTTTLVAGRSSAASRRILMEMSLAHGVSGGAQGAQGGGGVLSAASVEAALLRLAQRVGVVRARVRERYQARRSARAVRDGLVGSGPAVSPGRSGPGGAVAPGTHGAEAVVAGGKASEGNVVQVPHPCLAAGFNATYTRLHSYGIEPHTVNIRLVGAPEPAACRQLAVTLVTHTLQPCTPPSATQALGSLIHHHHHADDAASMAALHGLDGAAGGTAGEVVGEGTGSGDGESRGHDSGVVGHSEGQGAAVWQAAHEKAHAQAHERARGLGAGLDAGLGAKEAGEAADTEPHSSRIQRSSSSGTGGAGTASRGGAPTGDAVGGASAGGGAMGCASGMHAGQLRGSVLALTGFYVVWRFFMGSLEPSSGPPDPEQLRAAVQRLCGWTWPHLQSELGQQANVEKYCLWGHYVVELIGPHGLGLTPGQLTIGGGDVGWPLGAALSEASRAAPELLLPSLPLSHSSWLSWAWGQSDTAWGSGGGHSSSSGNSRGPQASQRQQQHDGASGGGGAAAHTLQIALRWIVLPAVVVLGIAGALSWYRTWVRRPGRALMVEDGRGLLPVTVRVTAPRNGSIWNLVRLLATE